MGTGRSQIGTSRRARLLRYLGSKAVEDPLAPIEQHRRALDRPGHLPLTRRVAWRRDGLGGVPIIRVAPKGGASQRGAIVFVHGGGYVGGSARTHLPFASRLSRRSDIEVILPDYRRAPEHPCPAAVDDSEAVLRAILAQTDPSLVTLAGDSAGGGAALAVACRLRDAGEPLPNGIYLQSPWTDLSLSGDSVRTRAGVDPMLDPVMISRMAAAYAGDLPVDDPVVSPLFSDLSGLPPILAQVDGDEILLSDSTRLVERARAHGVVADVTISAGLWHVYPLSAGFVPEADSALADAIAVIGSWRTAGY